MSALGRGVASKEGHPRCRSGSLFTHCGIPLSNRYHTPQHTVFPHTLSVYTTAHVIQGKNPSSRSTGFLVQMTFTFGARSTTLGAKPMNSPAGA